MNTDDEIAKAASKIEFIRIDGDKAVFSNGETDFFYEENSLRSSIIYANEDFCVTNDKRFKKYLDELNKGLDALLLNKQGADEPLKIFENEVKTEVKE